MEKNMEPKATHVQTPDYAAVKVRQKAAWSSGDYGKIGVTLQITGEELAEAADMPSGASILDVAAGNGNATMAFARRWCTVTSTDYVDTLLDAGRRRAEAEGLDVRFQIADAVDLPFADGSFDGVVSSFGVMFAPDQRKSASEMLRVCRDGGKIALANWTPMGFIGTLFKTLGTHVAPPAGVASPARWGDEKWIGETFARDARTIDLRSKAFNFRYRSPQQFVDFFRRFYGPMHTAFLSLDENGRQSLNDDLLKLIARFNVAKDGTMAVPSEYAEIIINV